MLHKPSLITVEGLDFTGKTTVCQYLKQLFKELNIPCKLFNGVSDGSIGTEIRSMLVNKRDEPLSCDSELLLYYATRMQIIKELVMPALEDGYVVVLDRFIDSTMAYQGYGLEMQAKVTAIQNTFIKPYLEIDHTLYLDATDAAIQHRRNKRCLETGVAPDRIECRDDEYFQRVRKGFEACRAFNPQRFHTIDASVNLDAVKEQVEVFVKANYKPVVSRFSNSYYAYHA